MEMEFEEVMPVVNWAYPVEYMKKVKKSKIASGQHL